MGSTGNIVRSGAFRERKVDALEIFASSGICRSHSAF
jgi:hypothetical protein